jgi:hypothetical protein
MPTDPKRKTGKPPYPDHECLGCELGKKLVVSPLRQNGMQAACHAPEGWVCMKYMPPVPYKAMRDYDQARRAR